MDIFIDYTVYMQLLNFIRQMTAHKNKPIINEHNVERVRNTGNNWQSTAHILT